MIFPPPILIRQNHLQIPRNYQQNKRNYIKIQLNLISQLILIPFQQKNPKIIFNLTTKTQQIFPLKNLLLHHHLSYKQLQNIAYKLTNYHIVHSIPYHLCQQYNLTQIYNHIRKIHSYNLKIIPSSLHPELQKYYKAIYQR